MTDVKQNKKKVLILGGTGFVGYYVIRALHEAGFKLGLMLHKKKDDINIPYDGYETFEGDIKKPQTLKKIMNEFKPDVVVHLVGIVREHPPNVTFEKIHVQGTQNIVDVSKQAGVDKIIYISALGADLEGPTKYYRSKAKAEQIIENSGLKYTILRPAIMFGWRSHFTNRIRFWAKILPFIPVIEKKGKKFHPLHAQTTGEIIARAAEGQGDNKTYELLGPEELSVYEVAKRIGKKMGSHKKVWPIPLLFARIGAFLGSLGLPSPVTKAELKMLLKGDDGNPTGMQNDFDVENLPLDPMADYAIY
ncbi:MAG: NAD(P)H-binding protein [Candidatus Spechtbacterales bacterium]|nr:NAD(P)H-binding protein [Candidatus Spechtbacterales bacterium]